MDAGTVRQDVIPAELAGAYRDAVAGLNEVVRFLGDRQNSDSTLKATHAEQIVTRCANGANLLADVLTRLGLGPAPARPTPPEKA